MIFSLCFYFVYLFDKFGAPNPVSHTRRKGFPVRFN